MTPFEWTRGRLLATAASLLVKFSEQVLKWQEPSSASTETISLLVAVLQAASKGFFFFRQHPLTPSQRINMQSP